jgi:hypothetical protein
MTSAISFDAPARAKEGKRVVFLAGPKSHGYGDHEFIAGSRMLADWLVKASTGIEEAETIESKWFDNSARLEKADAVIVFCDGLEQHIVNGKEEFLNRLHEAGKGIGVLHYACNVEKGHQGKRMLQWIGGYYEKWWSVNPIWMATFKDFPVHPVARGLSPFSIRDEWYFHMRFRQEMKDVIPILSAIPPDHAFSSQDGPYCGNPHVRATKGKPQHLLWLSENANGTRGFGFTGAHFHWNWGHPQMRKSVLNAIVWIAGLEPPKDGIPSENPTYEDLARWIPDPPPEGWNSKHWKKLLAQWQKGDAP